MRYQPVRDLVLVEPLAPEDVSPGGIFLPDKRQEEPAARGLVMEVGPELIGTPVEPGVRVVYRQSAASAVPGPDGMLHLVPYKEILAVVEVG